MWIITIFKAVHVKKRLDIKIYNKLNSITHVVEVCKKSEQKLNALSMVFRYIDLPKRRILLNAFFIPQFSYCPLVWMFHSRGKSNKIYRILVRRLMME